MSDLPSPLAPLRRNSTPRAVSLVHKGRIRRKVVLGEQYKMGSALGQGGHSSVTVASTRNEDGKEEKVAVKRTLVLARKGQEHLKVREVDKAVREAQLQAMCHDHPNIATAFDLVQDEHNVYLVMELAEGGDLFDNIVHHTPRTPDDALLLVRQLMSAVAHMHSLNIAHRDIKPENVVLTNHGKTPLLCDFGSAVEFKPGDPLLSKATGTTRCFPPEMFVSKKGTDVRQYDPMAMDVWCTGVLFFFVLTARFPFDGPTREDTISNIVNCKLTNKLPRSCPAKIVRLLEKMMHPNTAKRITMAEALRFVDNFDAEAKP